MTGETIDIAIAVEDQPRPEMGLKEGVKVRCPGHPAGFHRRIHQDCLAGTRPCQQDVRGPPTLEDREGSCCRSRSCRFVARTIFNACGQ